MTLSVNPTLDLITINSTLLNNYIANPAGFVDIVISIYHNDTKTPVSETYSVSVPITGITNVNTNAGVETILPAFFNVDVFTEGVYHVIIKLTSNSQIEAEEGCLYIEDGLKCTIDNVLIDETKSMPERVLIGLKYNMLLEVSNCDCKCTKYIDLYNNLIALTDSICKEC